jgi:hypothetical protein
MIVKIFYFLLENVFIYYKKCIELKFEIKGPFGNFDRPIFIYFLGLNKFLNSANLQIYHIFILVIVILFLQH